MHLNDIMRNYNQRLMHVVRSYQREGLDYVLFRHEAKLCSKIARTAVSFLSVKREMAGVLPTSNSRENAT